MSIQFNGAYSHISADKITSWFKPAWKPPELLSFLVFQTADNQTPLLVVSTLCCLPSLFYCMTPCYIWLVLTILLWYRLFGYYALLEPLQETSVLDLILPPIGWVETRHGSIKQGICSQVPHDVCIIWVESLVIQISCFWLPVWSSAFYNPTKILICLIENYI